VKILNENQDKPWNLKSTKCGCCDTKVELSNSDMPKDVYRETTYWNGMPVRSERTYKFSCPICNTTIFITI
jgi:hypothetical protein